MIGLLDPTRHWEPVFGPAPSPSGLQIPLLPFGSPLEAAQFLGKPDEFEWKSRRTDAFSLLYAAKGLRLEFEDGKLVEVAYLVSAAACSHKSFAPSTPLAPDGSSLAHDVDRARIIAIFGEPDPMGSDETCLQVFHGGGVVSDFYLDDEGHLTEWDLYPEN